MIEWLRKQIESLEWIKSWVKKNPVKNTLIILAILLVFFLYWDISQYSKISNQTDKIYIEILANMQELNTIISTEKDLSNIDYSKYEFITGAYNDVFTTNKKRLDRQVYNFYTNIKRVKVFTKKEEFEHMINQGNDIKMQLNYYFGCKDYFDYIEDWKKRPRVASEDSVVVRFSLIRYLRYKFR